jgi:hypothetical protein
MFPPLALITASRNVPTSLEDEKPIFLLAQPLFLDPNRRRGVSCDSYGSSF